MLDFRIDLPTVYLLTICSALMMGIAMLVTGRAIRGRVAGMPKWAAACFLQAAAWAVFMLQFAGQVALPALAGNTILLLALVLHYWALRDLLELAPGQRWLWLVTMGLMWAGLVFTAVLWPSFAGRLVVTSAAHAGPLLAGAWVVLRANRWQVNSHLLVGAGFAFFGLGLLVRLGLVLAMPQQFTGLTESQLTQDVFYILVNVWIVSLSFGFVLMAYEKLNKDLEVLATRDSLTGCYNRRMLEELLSKELAATRRSGQPLTILVLDLDRFKTINDTYGHYVGDRVLRALVATAKLTLRTQDYVGRIGGEEFVAVLPNTDAEGAVAVAERLRLAVAQMSVTHDGRPVAATVSIGICGISETVDTLPVLLQLADQALYTAKALGRNRVVLNDTKSHGAATMHVVTTSDMPEPEYAET